MTTLFAASSAAAFFAALALFGLAAPASAQSSKPRYIGGSEAHGVKAYAIQNPCVAGSADVDLIAEDRAIFTEPRRNDVRNVMSGVAYVIGEECAAQQVRIRKVTFAGYADGELLFAAAVTPNGGWLNVRSVEIDAATDR